MEMSQYFIDCIHDKIKSSQVTDPSVIFREDPDVRELSHFEFEDGEAMGITMMTEEEIRQSIIGDILIATMFEVNGIEFYPFTMEDLLKFIPVKLHNLIIPQMEHDQVKHIITTDNGQLRIRKEKEILKHAMNFSGIIYDGYDLDTTNCVSISSEFKTRTPAEITTTIVKALSDNKSLHTH